VAAGRAGRVHACGSAAALFEFARPHEMGELIEAMKTRFVDFGKVKDLKK
jgi:hypothetical protein